MDTPIGDSDSPMQATWAKPDMFTNLLVAITDVNTQIALCETVADFMAQMPSLKNCNILLVNHEGTELRLMASCGGLDHSNSKDITESTLQCLRIGAADDARKNHAEPLQAGQQEIGIAVPIISNKGIIGALYCPNTEIGMPREIARSTLETIALIIAPKLHSLNVLQRFQSKNKNQKSQIENLKVELKKLSSDRDKLSNFLSVSNGWVWEQDENLKFIHVEVYKKIPYVRDDSDLLGKTRWEVFGIDPDTDENWRNHVADLKARRAFKNFRYSITDKTGERFILSIDGVPAFSEDGTFTGYHGTASDATPLVKAEKDNVRFLEAIDYVPVAFAMYDKDERLITSNELFRSANHLAGKVMYKGMRYESWLNESLKHGLFGKIPDGMPTNTFRAARLELFRNPHGPIEVHQKGRWFRVEHVRLLDGSTVQTGVDITDYKTVLDRFEMASKAAGIGVFSWIPENGGGTLSKSFQAILGLKQKANTMSMKLLVKLIHKEDVEMVLSEFGESAKLGSNFNFECRILGPGQQYFWANLQGYMVKTKPSREWFGILQDISERKQQEEAKAAFVATVSHELRTPLTAILGGLNLLVTGSLDGKPKVKDRMLNHAKQNADRLLLMVNDILDFEKYSSEHLNFEIDDFSANFILEEAENLNGAYAHAYGVTLKSEFSQQDYQVQVDNSRIQQVLSNLISNAVKFTPKGGEIVISCYQDGSNGIFKVHNFGNTIPEEFKPTIFDRFSQADNSDKRKVGGTGLGLAIAKSMTEGQNGMIDFESTPDEGTTFWVSFPLSEMKVPSA